MKKSNPFEELLERLESRGEDGDGDGDDDKSDRHPKLSHAEMIKHLKVGHALLTRVSDLKPGDIIRGIRELTESHIRDWDHPHILLEILSEPLTLSLDGENIGVMTATKRYDCVVACCVPVKGNGWILRHYADLRDWEIYPDADKLKVDTHS